MTKKGFTLIELLVVISIIGILIAVGSVSYQKSVKLGRDSRRQTDLEQIRQALETYRSEEGVYAPDLDDLSPDYLTVVPVDPQTGDYSYTRDTVVTYTLCAPEIELDDTYCVENP